MIGVSLSYKWLLTGGDGYGLDVRKTLTELSRCGVDSIELRTVLPGDSPEGVLSVAERLWNFGFNITVHSRMHSAKSAVSDVLDPLRPLLCSMKQEKLVIVLHPIIGDNVAILNALADDIEKNGYSAVIALENNRLMPDETEGDSAAYVLDVVKAVNRPAVGICFDMGHYMYYRRKHHPESSQVLPPADFIKRTVHTHIHALAGLKTHFPLVGYDLPLDELCRGIAWGYFGVYNFEPDLPRWGGAIDPLPAILDSVAQLKERMPFCARMYDGIRRNFDDGFRRALTVYDGIPEQGTRAALVNSSGYLFNTGGYLWAMDIAFRYARHLAKTPALVADLLKDVKLMVVTHGHVDHFEEETVRLLAKTDMLWVIPDFLYDNAIEWDVKPENIVVARKNESICIDKLTIVPFAGKHFRPIVGTGIEAYGYHISADGHPSMAFPGDVRDYSRVGLESVPEADCCFGHVWFGDGNSFDASHSEIAKKQAEFLLSFSNRHIVLAHLYENGRRDQDMWREEHADELSEMIKQLSPATRITVPHHGDIFLP